jgi:hypothetical protein
LPAVNARLFVKNVREGSIIVTLQTLLDQASFLVKHIEVLGGFVANLNDIILFLLNQDKQPKPEGVTPQAVERLATIVEPVAKDAGASLALNVSNNSGPVVFAPQIYINYEKANTVQNQARRYLGAKPPTDGKFENELLRLHQMKDDPKAKTGDRGIIEKFSNRPVKLHFMTPDVKSAILDQPHTNLFKKAYIVDGEVSTVDGQPGLYKIKEVHEAIDRPD